MYRPHGAIEMAGWLHIKVSLIKDGMAKYGIKNPIFRPSPIAPKYDDYLIFEGISVDESGTQHYLGVTTAYRQGLSQRHRIPQEIRIFRRSGLFHSWHCPGAGPRLRGRGYSQCLRDALATD
jgi:acetamidase/formamidase